VVSARKSEQISKNFASSLTDHDLQFITSRLFYQYQDDLYVVFERFAEMKKQNRLENIDVDYSLGNAKTYQDFYKQLDMISVACMKEYEKRGGNRLNLI